MTFEKVLLETPAGQRLLAETRRETVREDVFRVLRKRFGAVPEDLAAQRHAIQEQQKLDDLFDLAVGCPDLDAFQKAISAP
jgi:hypothetical protein